MKSVGILYICTGRYALFFERFIHSCERYFLKDCSKEYFIFTDKKQPSASKRCHFIYQRKLGWPFDTLLRFHMSHSKSRELIKMDYLFFFNANSLFVQDVTEEVLPDGLGLVGAIHPGFYGVERARFTYEVNPVSSAYIAPDEGVHYFAGAFNGGSSSLFLEMSYRLALNIEADLDKKYVAIWHDESHLNRYFIDNPPKVLDPSYVYPEGWHLPFEPKVLILDKTKFGGHDYLRNTFSRLMRPIP